MTRRRSGRGPTATRSGAERLTPDGGPDAARLEALQRALLGWAATEGRDLPWRGTRDPWAVLVSEAMLQQTQVARVLPRYEAFLARFPSAPACAAAPQAAVVRAWEGLGYNRRAVQLHATAVAVTQRHGGVLPADLDALLALPGVGPYTARAVLAFAYERDTGVLDVNAARVVARAVAGRRLGGREAQALADAAVPVGQGWTWNQAVLDLGAGVCTKRAPACGRCPLAAADACAWGGDAEVADPADGSAGTGSRQSAFDGSDRQGRGRLVDALRRRPVTDGELAAVMGWADDAERAVRVAGGVVRDGLVRRTPGGYELA